MGGCFYTNTEVKSFGRFTNRMPHLPNVEVVGGVWVIVALWIEQSTSHNTGHEARARVLTLPDPRGSMVEKLMSITPVNNGHQQRYSVWYYATRVASRAIAHRTAVSTLSTSCVGL
jgi:hypothetical protein